ncbi:MAG: hypothetical protein ACOC4M_17500 [Promethearchaeia archaeon]
MTDCYVISKNLEEKTEQWLEKIALFNTHQREFEINASALLIIDMQKFF